MYLKTHTINDLKLVVCIWMHLTNVSFVQCVSLLKAYSKEKFLILTKDLGERNKPSAMCKW